MAFIVIDQSKPSSAHTGVGSGKWAVAIANYGLNYSLKANYSYINFIVASYDILHKKVCEMSATIRNTFVWRFSRRYTPAQSTKAISKQNKMFR